MMQRAVKFVESRMRKRKPGCPETKEDCVEKLQSTRCVDPDREPDWVWKSGRKGRGTFQGCKADI